MHPPPHPPPAGVRGSGCARRVLHPTLRGRRRCATVTQERASTGVVGMVRLLRARFWFGVLLHMGCAVECGGRIGTSPSHDKLVAILCLTCCSRLRTPHSNLALRGAGEATRLSPVDAVHFAADQARQCLPFLKTWQAEKRTDRPRSELVRGRDLLDGAAVVPREGEEGKEGGRGATKWGGLLQQLQMQRAKQDIERSRWTRGAEFWSSEFLRSLSPIHNALC